MSRIAGTITGRRTAWAVTVVGFLLGLLTVVALGEAERSPSPTDTLPVGYGSTEAEVLRDQLPEDDESAAIVLFTAEEAIDSHLPELESVMAEVSGDAGSAGQDGRQGRGGPPARVVPAEDGTAALGVLTVPSATATETSAEVSALRAELTDLVPHGVTAQVTGPAAVQADLAAVFEGADVTLLAFTASVVAVLLLITYRSPTLWVIPLAVVGLADRAAAILATQLLAAVGVPWDESTIGILSVLVFGAGTNYALLLVSRYRDELRLRADRHEAMALALRRTSEAVFASASTVFLGLLTLLLSVFPTTRGLGLACAIGVLVAAAFVLLLLPALLVLFGRWVFWPKVPREDQAVLAESRSLWSRVGSAVAARPPVFIAGTLVVLLAMGAGVTQLRLGLPASEQFLDEPEAVSAAERVAESFPAGSSDPTVVVTGSVEEATVAALQEELTAVPGVFSVRPGAQGGGVTELEVVLTAQSGTDEAVAVVEDLRDVSAGTAETYVTGSTAQAIDARDGAASDRLLLMPLILVLVLGALMGILRSVLAPVLLVVSVVVSYSAALGAAWWLFTGPLGFTALDESVPLLSFLFLVALGVDYNIFLITRTLEEARTEGTRRGVLRALSATGGVITSAGILLAAVFAVLGVLPLVVLAQIGVVICIGVLLDTLLVRTVLVPATVLALGGRFWWPRRLDSRPGSHCPERTRGVEQAAR